MPVPPIYRQLKIASGLIRISRGIVFDRYMLDTFVKTPTIAYSLKWNPIKQLWEYMDEHGIFGEADYVATYKDNRKYLKKWAISLGESND